MSLLTNVEPLGGPTMLNGQNAYTRLHTGAPTAGSHLPAGRPSGPIGMPTVGGSPVQLPGMNPGPVNTSGLGSTGGFGAGLPGAQTPEHGGSTEPYLAMQSGSGKGGAGKGGSANPYAGMNPYQMNPYAYNPYSAGMGYGYSPYSMYPGMGGFGGYGMSPMGYGMPMGGGKGGAPSSGYTGTGGTGAFSGIPTSNLSMPGYGSAGIY